MSRGRDKSQDKGGLQRDKDNFHGFGKFVGCTGIPSFGGMVSEGVGGATAERDIDACGHHDVSSKDCNCDQSKTHSGLESDVVARPSHFFAVVWIRWLSRRCHCQKEASCFNTKYQQRTMMMLGKSLRGPVSRYSFRGLATVGDKSKWCAEIRRKWRKHQHSQCPCLSTSTVPPVELQAGWPPQKHNLAEFAANKKIILMGLPGACKCCARN